jgi:hypothetical protein
VSGCANNKSGGCVNPDDFPKEGDLQEGTTCLSLNENLSLSKTRKGETSSFTFCKNPSSDMPPSLPERHILQFSHVLTGQKEKKNLKPNSLQLSSSLLFEA